MTLEKIIKKHEITHYQMYNSKDIIDKLIFRIVRARHLDIHEFWYDDSDDPNWNNWIDVEGIGYGWISVGTKLRQKFRFLQRIAVKSFIIDTLKHYEDIMDQIIVYRDSDGNMCYGFMDGLRNTCFIKIRIGKKELYPEV